MQYHVSTKGFEPSDNLHVEIEKKRQKLAKLVEQFPQDVIHLDLTMERQPRREEYIASLRLGLTGTVLAAHERGVTPENALHKAVNILETELAHYKARLRHENAVSRRREDLTTVESDLLQDDLRTERELLDRCLAGNKAAFDDLVKEYMPELLQAVREEAARTGPGKPLPSDEELRAVVQEALAEAFQRLPHEPPRANLANWLVAEAINAWQEHLGEAG